MHLTYVRFSSDQVKAPGAEKTRHLATDLREKRVLRFLQGDHDGVAVVVDRLQSRQLVVVLEVQRPVLVHLGGLAGRDVDGRLAHAVRALPVPISSP